MEAADLRGILVKHKKFGEGVIKQYDEKYITIAFSQEEKEFVFLDAFERFISVIDDKNAVYVELELQKKRQMEIEKQQKILNDKKKKKEQQKIQQNINSVNKSILKKEYIAPQCKNFDINAYKSVVLQNCLTRTRRLTCCRVY